MGLIKGILDFGLLLISCYMMTRDLTQQAALGIESGTHGVCLEARDSFLLVPQN